MDLKEWNTLQCSLLKECHINVSNILEVYKIGSLISHLRQINDSEEALLLAKKLLADEGYTELSVEEKIIIAKSEAI